MNTIEIQTEIEPSDINNGSTRVLFVEGFDKKTDASVLTDFFHNINIKGLGASLSLKSAASAFMECFPLYYFIIDRDGHTESDVNQAWDDFKNKKTNLLIWRKKEFESYFLDPQLLLESRYIKKGVTEEALQSKIIQFAKDKVYWYALRRTIVSLREKIKRNWISIPKYHEGVFDSIQSSVDYILKSENYHSHKRELPSVLEDDNVMRIYTSELQILTGGASELTWDVGSWLDLIPAKKVLNDVIFSGNFFKRVGRLKGQKLSTQEELTFILNDLLSNEDHVPQDFLELRNLLDSVNV